MSCDLETGSAWGGIPVIGGVGIDVLSFKPGCTSGCRQYSAHVTAWMFGLAWPGITAVNFWAIFSGADEPWDFNGSAGFVGAGAAVGPIGVSYTVIGLGSASSIGIGFEVGIDLGVDIFGGVATLKSSSESCQPTE
ncbi:MAG: hypothetical protein KBC05_16380 [Candidatus Hydrogenedentes bacterium]|nr:hypothetical protein [Candidatus Hydrogenedentota bacterium]